MPVVFLAVVTSGLLLSGTVKLDTVPPRIDHQIVAERQAPDVLGFND